MQKLQMRFLEAVEASLKNEKVSWDDLSSQDWEELFRLARAHHMMPMFFETVYFCPAFATAPAALVARTKLNIRMTVGQQMTKTVDFLQIFEQLCKAGVKPLVVKGIVCRNLYPKPDWRSSGDEDVLIDPKEYWLCKMTLAQLDVLPEKEQEEAYEVPFRQKDGPLLIELHKSLFPPESEAYGEMNGLFTDVRDRAVGLTVQGRKIRTLAPTDHMLYLICHAFKHFLHSGFGIRQVCDMVLYANTYGDQIDWQYVLDGCKTIRAEKFAAALLRIGEEYLTFDPEKAHYPACWQEMNVDPEALLEELVSAGIYGQADKARLHSGNITLNAVAAQKQGRKAKNGLVASLFPPVRILQGRYPYLHKRPWLLPVAWVSRIAQYGNRSRDEDDSNAAQILRMGNHRVELMRQYGIIE